MPSHFQIHKFAAHAGVTVKALRLYDRLGILVPTRSEAGHRIYKPSEVARVRQIVALKRLGVPLRSVGALLNGSDAELDSLLRQQRRILEDRRQELERLIRAVEQAEGDLAGRSPSAVLDSLVESVAAQDDIEAVRQYYPPQTWQFARTYYEAWPSEDWRQLHHDVRQALEADPDLDPASDIAQSLATRWLALDADDMVPPGVRLGHRRAWAHRQRWPPALRVRVTERERGRVAQFAAVALWERRAAELIAQGRPGAIARVSEARRRLYHHGIDLVGQLPASPAAQDLRSRWEAIVNDETSGNSEMKSEMICAFKSRHQWGAGVVRCVAASYGLEASTWSAVADLIEAAHDHAVSGN